MKTQIKELALVVSQGKLDEPLWPFWDKKVGSPQFLILEKLLSQESLTEDPGPSAGPGYIPFDALDSKKTLHKLRSNLINSLFFLKSRHFSDNDRNRALYECAKQWAAVRILLLQDARRTAVMLAEETIKTALHFEFSDIAIDIARVLRLHFGLREGNQKKYQYYDDLCTSLSEIITWEDTAEQLYAGLTINYVNSKSTKIDIRDQARQALSKLAEGAEKAPTYRFLLSSYLLQLMVSTAANDYASAAEACKKAIETFESKKYSTHLPLQIFYYQLLVCYTQIRDYNRGAQAALKCQDFLTEGSFNWFKYLELEFVLSIHTQRYQEAYEVYCRATASSKFQGMPENVRETWSIYEAYLHFLVNLEKIRPTGDDARFNNFRLGKFLNMVPVYLKDKRGMNIPILVVHILLMIQQNRYDEAIDRMEAIAKYCSRYLVRDDSFRSNCFIKLLLLIPANSFHQAAVIRKASGLLQKLKSMPLELARQSHEIEIIPYEHLWALTIQLLQNSFVERKNQRYRKHM